MFTVFRLMNDYSWLYISRRKQKLGEIKVEQCLTHVKKISMQSLELFGPVQFKVYIKVSRLSEVFRMDEIGIYITIVSRLQYLIHAKIMD